MHNLSEKAMLVRLSISQWSARKYDAAATAEVIQAHQAAADSGRFNKMLVDLEAVKRYQKISGEARTFHYSNTLPWGDDDSRILPAANFLCYSEKMRALRARFDSAVFDFVGEYPDLIIRAQRDLNGLFKASDYPTVADLPNKYHFAFAVLPLPVAADFRVDLQAAEVDRLRADIEAQVNEAVAAAVKSLWARLRDVVSKLSSKLHDSDSIFRDSLIANIREVCDLIPRLNFTGEAALDSMAAEVAAGLGSLDADSLRGRDLERSAAAREADAILAKMAAYCGE